MSYKFELPRAGYKTVVEVEDGIAKSHTVQPNRNAILDRNNELRKNPGVVRPWEFGKLALDIPHADFKMLGKFFPGLDNPGHPDHKYQMQKFMKSPAADPYRVEERKRRGGL
jgi:hypothetical protein